MLAIGLPVDRIEQVTISERVRIAREESGKSKQQVEQEAGLSSGSLTRIENGTRKEVGASLLSKIALALGVNITWLATGEGPQLPLPADVDDERYPNRGIAIQAARMVGLSEHAISTIKKAKLNAKTDPTTRWWFEQIQDLDKIDRLGVREVWLENEEEDDTRPSHRTIPVKGKGRSSLGSLFHSSFGR